MHDAHYHTQKIPPPVFGIGGLDNIVRFKIIRNIALIFECFSGNEGAGLGL